MSNKAQVIHDYYLLCAAGGKAKHSINNIGVGVDVIFTKKEIDLYFRKKDDNYVIKEFIIGGGDSSDSKQTKVIVIC